MSLRLDYKQADWPITERWERQTENGGMRKGGDRRIAASQPVRERLRHTKWNRVKKPQILEQCTD